MGFWGGKRQYTLLSIEDLGTCVHSTQCLVARWRNWLRRAWICGPKNSECDAVLNFSDRTAAINVQGASLFFVRERTATCARAGNVLFCLCSFKQRSTVGSETLGMGRRFLDSMCGSCALRVCCRRLFVAPLAQ